MELVNELYALEDKLSPAPLRDILEKLALMLAPFAPYTAQELWEILGHSSPRSGNPGLYTIPNSPKRTLIQVVVQVNGKVRGHIEVSPGTPESVLKELALANDKVQPFLAGKQIVKVIVVPDKLVNIVVR